MYVVRTYCQIGQQIGVACGQNVQVDGMSAWTRCHRTSRLGTSSPIGQDVFLDKMSKDRMSVDSESVRTMKKDTMSGGQYVGGQDVGMPRFTA